MARWFNLIVERYNPSFERWSIAMIDFSWKVFSMTGSIDTYLLIKELENEMSKASVENKDEESQTIDAH